MYALNLNGQVISEKINSSSLNETRLVDIYLPENISENIIKTPLILVLEGNELFDLVVSNVKYLSKIGYMPPSIVLGIRQDKLNQVYKDCEVDKNRGFLTDFSQNFMKFIVSEAIPLISKKYGDPFLKIIIGRNYSANFINHFIFSTTFFDGKSLGKLASKFSSWPVLLPSMPLSLKKIKPAIMAKSIISMYSKL